MLHNWSKLDVEMSRALRSAFSQGSFQIKGDAIVRVGKIVEWLEVLDKKIEKSIESKTIRKDLGETDGDK